MNESRHPIVEEEEEAGSGFLNHLPAILWQRRWILLVPLTVFSIAGLAAAFLLPTVYRSTAVLLVESQELPPELVGSPVTAMIDQRIAKIRQRVLSRGDLIDLIQQNNLYAEERREEPLSKIIERMREDTTVAAVSADIGQAGNSKGSTIAFSMSYDYKEPRQAQLVMQRFVERFLEIDSTQMAEQASSTVSFLEEQATSLQQQIAQIEGQITQIKAQHGTALASSGLATMSTPGSYDAQIAALQRENLQLLQQARAVRKDPVVASAEAQVAAARAIYTENHPDVVFAKQRLEEARKLAVANPANDAATAAAAQIEANNAQIAALGRARSNETARSSAMLAAQSRVPVVMEQVAQLDNRANNLRAQYQQVSGKLLAAQSSARMEEEQKGERLAVIDPPVVPDEPISPNRPLLILGGIFGGAGLGFVLVLMLEALLRPIRGVAQLERIVGAPPLVVIPTLKRKPGRLDRLIFWRRSAPA